MSTFRYLRDGVSGGGIAINIDRIEVIRERVPDGSVILFAGDDHTLVLPDSSLLNTMRQLGLEMTE